MNRQIPKLAGLFGSRLNSLKFGIAVWIVQVVSIPFGRVLNPPQQIMLHGEPVTFLSLWPLGSVVALVLVLYAYRKTSQAFKDYQLRVEMAAASPTFAELHSMSNPLIYTVRDLLDRSTWIFVIVLMFALGDAGHSARLVCESYLALTSKASTDLVIRLIFHGVSAALFFILVVWSGLNLFRTHRMYRLLKVRSEETERKLAPKFGKYSGKCIKCGREIRVGEIAHWDAGKGVWHVRCEKEV